MSNWDPISYARFEAERRRPSVDLLARVPDGLRRRIVDLGCGGGLSTLALRARYPDADLLGIDASADMLSAAPARLPNVRFLQADVAQWDGGDADLLFANALFQWVPGHIGVMARLAGGLPPGGCLAAQMPDNEAEPSHALMREVAAQARFREKMGMALAARETIGAFADYDAALSAACDDVDIWRTIYVHRLESPEAIVAWVEGAGLRPYLAPLTPDERLDYLEDYRVEIAKAYPRRAWGGVLLPFPRLFVVARRAAGNGGLG